MGKNIEIKAKMTDPQLQVQIVESIADGDGEILFQEDIFFNTKAGRLKLRKFQDGTGELIHYHRDDSTGPTMSEYLRYPANTPDSLQAVLTASLGIFGVVRKKRTVYLHGQTRIHLDEVEDLGAFIELEVVLRPEDSNEKGTRIANELMEKLGIREQDLLAVAYVDLLRQK